MSAIEVQETQLTADGRGNSMVFAGTWVNTANTAYSGGNAQVSTVVASTCTVTFVGRALYLLTEHNSIGGTFSVTIDGTLANGSINCGGAVQMYRVLQPIARNLTDTTHTAIITVLSGSVTVDSFFVPYGALIAPTAGNLVCLGDSVTFGTGSSDTTRFSFVSRLAEMLGTQTGTPTITTYNKGVSSDNLFCKDNTHFGGMYRLLADVLPNAPQYLTLLFGINDLYTNSGQAIDFVRQYIALLQFLEDTLDTSKVNIAIGTMSYPTPNFTGISINSTGSKDDNYLVGIAMVRALTQRFTWLKLADLYAVMQPRVSYTYPNATGTKGDIHPNDAGHGLIAFEFWRALVLSSAGMY